MRCAKLPSFCCSCPRACKPVNRVVLQQICLRLLPLLSLATVCGEHPTGASAAQVAGRADAAQLGGVEARKIDAQLAAAPAEAASRLGSAAEHTQEAIYADTR